MALVINCPSCERKLRVPNELLGMKVKCPTCSTMFTAADSPAPAGAAEPQPATENAAPAPAPEITPVGEPLALESAPAAPPSEQKICPGCAGSIPREATRCRYCGESVGGGADSDNRPWEQSKPVRRDFEPHRGALLLVFGILSIVLSFTWIASIVGLPLGIAAWIMGSKDLPKMRRRELDPQGLGLTQAGWICGIIGTIFSALGTLCCLGYVGIIAFAINSQPPPRNFGPPPNPPRRKMAAPLISEARALSWHESSSC